MERIMNFVFVILFCIVFGSIINEGWIISIDEDATELTRLFEEFWSFKPDVLKEEGPLAICQFIDQCCKDEDRSRAISALIDSMDKVNINEDYNNRIINECINTTDLKESIQSCPSIRHILYPVITQQDSLDGIEYAIFMNYTATVGKLANHEDGFCNNEEIYAVLCSSNVKLITSCFTKSLQNIYDENDYEVYRRFVMEAKQNFTDANQQLFQLEMKKMHKQMKPFLRVLSKYYSKKH
jgi:hypothetical protein